MSSHPQDLPPSPASRRVTGTVSGPSEQRRAHYRADDDQPVLVELAGAAEALDGQPDATSFVARLNDLSESGLRLQLPADRCLLLAAQQEVDLVVSLPATNERLRARVVHREPATAAGEVVLGLAFVDQDRASADRIRRHVFAVQREALARRRVETTGNGTGTGTNSTS